MRLTHEALFFQDEGSFVDALVPFLRGGLEAEVPTAVATTPEHIGLLRATLGPDADQVRFLPDLEWYVRPASTVEGWHEELRRRPEGLHAPNRMVGEVPFGDEPARQRTWTRYESALNGVFADANAWIVCPYDLRRLPSHVIADAERTHPTLRNRRSQRHPYEEPEAFLRRVAEVPIQVAGSPTLSMSVREEPAEVRAALRTLAAGVLPHQRVEDLALVTTEAMANTLLHGGGSGTVQAWLAPGEVVVQVSDAGGGLHDPLAGYRPPARDAVGGMGLWVARRLSDAFTVDASDEGTTVRMLIRR